eukprot:6219248-Karenia_brevis.AAC.1
MKESVGTLRWSGSRTRRPKLSMTFILVPPVDLNSVQLNTHDGPWSKLGLHSDNKPDGASIVSVSFGAPRNIHIQQ